MNIFGDIIFEIDTFRWGIESVLSIAIVVVFVSFVCILPILATTGKNSESAGVFGALIVVGFFGALVGFHGGNSRVGVVGDLIPAVVTLVAGFAVYIFGISDKKPGPYFFPMLASFIITLFITWSIGSANNAANEAYKECNIIFSNPDILASDIAWERAVGRFSEYCDL